MSTGKATTKKRRKKKTGPSEFEQSISMAIESGEISQALGVAILGEDKALRSRIKKIRLRVSELEDRILTPAGISEGMLQEKLAKLDEVVEEIDMRTTRMGVALRQCMRKLEVKRPSG